MRNGHAKSGLRVLYAASELAPWCKTGGLADVSAALPVALAQLASIGPIAVVAPLCRGARLALDEGRIELDDKPRSIRIRRGALDLELGLRTGRLGAARLGLVEAPELFEREGMLGSPNGADYPDNPARFAALCLAALEGCESLLDGPPDVVHANDWQTGLLPLYLTGEGYRDRYPTTASLFTIHNLAYQGVFDKRWVERLGIDWSLFVPDAVELHDRLSLLKAGVACADAVTTVSPRYAEEIQHPELGFGLDGFLRANARRLTGILNGIETDVWSPATDPHIPARYSADDPAGKRLCRSALLAEVGLEAGDNDPVIGIVARLAEQKGLDLVADIVPELPRLGAKLILLGHGDAELDSRFRRLARRYPERLAVAAPGSSITPADEALSHRIHAGVDIFLMPSRYEPCGLNQMYAMAYGSVPVVHSVGGLADTVIDATPAALARDEATGFSFAEPSAPALLVALTRAGRMYRRERTRWSQLMQAGMRRDLGWSASAGRYAALYGDIRRAKEATPA